MLRFTCPCCGAVNEIDALVQHEYGRKAVVAAAQLPPALFAQTMRYLRLFVSASAPQRSLTMDRAATLLDALVQAITAGLVNTKGRDWAAPVTVWPDAFDAVFAAVADGRRKLPLTNHAYLFGCIANMANATEAKAEDATEAQRKGGRVLATQTPFDANDQHTGAVLVKSETSTYTQSTPDPSPTLVLDSEPLREIPDFVQAAFAKLSGNKSMQAVTAQQAKDDAPADPLLGQMAGITKGKWKGKGGTIVRVVGDQVYVAIVFPRNGLQTIPFNRSELSL